MKKRLLLLVPCILLLLGFLTACTGSGTTSEQTAEQKIAGTTWSMEDNSALEGLIDIDLPFGMGDLVTVRFDDNGRGVVKVLNQNLNFSWNVQGGKIVMAFDGKESKIMDFYLDDDSLVLKSFGLNINLKH